MGRAGQLCPGRGGGPWSEGAGAKFASLRAERSGRPAPGCGATPREGPRRQPLTSLLLCPAGDAFILVFSLDNRESFEEAQRLKQQILDTKSRLRSRPKGRVDVPLVLCGNKGDRGLHREVEPAEVRQLLGDGRQRCAYFEVSAKKNSSLEPMFRALFAMAGLPGEMSPGLHRRVSAQHCEALHQALRGGKPLRAGGPGGALGVVAPFARRPSVHSDLLCVREKAGGPAKDRERCVIS